MQEDLIKKYFSGDCSPEEKRRIYLYFRKNPSLFLEHFSEEEWDALHLDQLDMPPVQKNEPPFRGLYAPSKKRNPFLYRGLIIILAFLLLLIPVFLFKPQKTVPVAQQHTDSTSSQVIVHTNTSSKTETLTLPDGSVIELYAGGSIRYLNRFEPEKRELHLQGTATFRVAKDPQRPFTVFCNGVATTALGTVFTINSSPKGNISVKLIEGKIKVRSVKKNDRYEEYYLLAGNSISFDAGKNEFRTTPSLADDTPAAAGRQRAGIRVTPDGNTYFDNEALPKVLDYLAVKYNVKIVFPVASTASIRFVGTIYNNEPITDVLRNISLMTNLELSLNTTTASDTSYVLKPAP